MVVGQVQSTKNFKYYQLIKKKTHMKKLLNLMLICLVSMQFANAQGAKKTQSYDISKDRVLYTVGYAHLDTEWNWDYPTTINEYILNTMTENFYLFEKYPDYVFNFTGSRRYNMMKEYYPEMYKKVQAYVKQGRWRVSGSSVDEGEVNISSSESLVRQILYGNEFFRKEFGTESVDYMLPDCFGFLCNLPTVFNHSGLLGFSTQKLTWRSAAGVPFNVGVWNGPDDKGIIAALNATDYTGRVENRLDKSKEWIDRLDGNKKNTGYAFDYRYFGVGDRGGAPREKDVINAINSSKNTDGNFKVVLSSSDQMYKDITPEIRQKLPTYKGDLLLIEHSAGSMTSQAYMKRINRKNELLAQSAEQVSVVADWLGGAKYPLNKLNNAWDLVLGSQFHDILPGTSIPKAYEYAWNDEFIAANGFSEVLKNGVSAVSAKLNTQTQGKSLVVYNPVARQREDIVTAELTFDSAPAAVSVFDKSGKEVPSQIIEQNGNNVKFIFVAQLPSAGMAVYDVRETAPTKAQSTLTVTNNTIENAYYKVKIADNGDVISIFDKKATKEILSKPARLEFLAEKPENWPSWNMDWKDRQKPAIDFMDKDTKLSIVEQGPVRVTIKVERSSRNSEIIQYYSLTTGEAGKRFEVTNKIDWQSRGVSLKASFPLTVSNENATYNLGVGTISRGNNNEKQFEVPSKEWFDLTDKSGKYGVSILEDCKFGSDKPDNNTLRLTLLYTPAINNGWGWTMYEATQDWGIHDFKYAIYGHNDSWAKAESAWQAKFMNQPLMAFESPKHAGNLGQSISMLSINNPQVGVMAFKKMENSDYYVVRFNELSGKDLKNIKATFPAAIVDAYEVNGQEQRIGSTTVNNGVLAFDLSHYTIRSFAVKLKNGATKTEIVQTSVELPFNADGISYDQNRSDGNLNDGQSIPAELLPAMVVSEDIRFTIGNKADGDKNVLACDGQTIQLPAGEYTKVYLLATASDDVHANFAIDGQTAELNIQQWNGYVGQFYNRLLTRNQENVEVMENSYVKNDNIAWFASHTHSEYPMKNETYQYCYLYKYEMAVPAGAKTMVLPKDRRIKVLAMTIAQATTPTLTPTQALYDNFKENKKFFLRAEK